MIEGTLRRGDRVRRFVKYNSSCRSRTYRSRLGADSIFGAGTEKAITVAFQMIEGLRSTESPDAGRSTLPPILIRGKP